MSTPSPQAPATSSGSNGKREIRIYSHSALFYWWPVWATAFLMAILTLLNGSRMAIVPANTVAAKVETEKTYGQLLDEEGKPSNKSEKLDGRYVLVAPPDRPLESPHLFMHPSKNLGVLFITILLVIIFISNVPLRGLWSLIVVLGIVLISVIFALADVWSTLLGYFVLLQIHINMAGYMAIGGVLFIIWAVTVFMFDRRRYVVVTSGQVRVCEAVGSGEQLFDVTGMSVQKRQDDLFRHWIVGLGSGDLIIPATASHKEIDMPNVLFIGSKIREIEKLIKEREVV